MLFPDTTACNATIFLGGEYDVGNCGYIGEAVAAALRHPEMSEVSLDMSEVSFLDSTALGAMVAARHACAAHGAGLQVRNPSPPVRRLLRITGLDQVFLPAPADGPAGAG